MVTFPDFDVGATQGDSFDEAFAQAVDLLETMVANYMAEGWELPASSVPAGRPLVRLAPLVAAKAEIYRAMRAGGVSKAELTRRIGISPQRVASWPEASQRMEVEAGLMQRVEACRVIDRRQAQECPALQIDSDTRAFAGLKQLSQPAVPETLDHQSVV